MFIVMFLNLANIFFKFLMISDLILFQVLNELLNFVDSDIYSCQTFTVDLNPIFDFAHPLFQLY